MNVDFDISFLTIKELNNIVAAGNEPHYHEYEQIVIGIEGNIKHFIDFKLHEVNSPFITFITKGKIHQLVPDIKNKKSKMWVIRFKSHFIPSNTFQLYSYFHECANIEIENKKAFLRMLQLAEFMHEETQQDKCDMVVLFHLLSALISLIETERIHKFPNSQVSNHSTVFKKFLELLEENYKSSLGVEYYANKLYMTSRSLNTICQNILHQSVTEIIESRKLIEAKNLLMNTDKTISEIGYELGYLDKSHFTNVFKKRNTQTPTEFRERIQGIIAKKDNKSSNI